MKAVNYILIILIASLFTAGLNVLHARYALNIPLTAKSFIAPVFAGVIFGAMLAHIKLLSERLAEMAYIDSLTNIFNRTHFVEYLTTEIDKVKRYGGKFSIIFFDIDHFKHINDHYGHQTGDDVLRSIGKIVSNANRGADVFARYGGEEFIILASSTDLQGAGQHAERLRQDIEAYPFVPHIKITSSFGVTEFRPESDDLTSLIKRADVALYQAKSNGRNNVVLA